MIRAYVHDQWNAFGVGVTIVREYPDSARRDVLQIGEHGIQSWKQIESSTEDVRPTLTLSHEEAGALLAGLAARYQGVDDQRALRRDYDAERGRVDKLTDAVIDMAKGLAAPLPPAVSVFRRGDDA